MAPKYTSIHTRHVPDLHSLRAPGQEPLLVCAYHDLVALVFRTVRQSLRLGGALGFLISYVIGFETSAGATPSPVLTPLGSE